jgi:hypothetical protein
MFTYLHGKYLYNTDYLFIEDGYILVLSNKQDEYKLHDMILVNVVLMLGESGKMLREFQ